MAGLLSTFLETTVYSGILFIVILLFKKVFHKRISASLNYAVWILLVVRLLVPVTVDSNIRLFVIPEDAVPAVQTGTEAVSDFSFNTGTGTESTGHLSQSQQLQNTSTDVNTGSTESDTPVQAVSAVHIGWETALVFIWALGMIVYLTYIAFLHMRFRRVMKHSNSNVPYDVLAMVDECRKELKIRADIQVLLQSGMATPALTLSLRPVLLLPESMLGAMSYVQVELSIRHELMHYKRRDHLMRLLLMLLQCVYWFNPFLWAANKIMLTDMEAACDACVTARLDKEKRNLYINTIIDLGSDSYAHCALGMGTARGKKNIERRIRGMFMKKKSRRSTRAAVSLLVPVMLFMCFTTACQPTPEELVVKNKEGDEMLEALNATAEPNASNSLNSGTMALTGHIAQSTTNDLGTIAVNIDADVVTPEVDRIPAAVVERGSFTQEQVDSFIEVLMEGATLHETDTPLTKEQIQEEIIKLERSATDLNSDMAQSEGITSLTELRERADELIAEWEKKYAAAPDNYEYTEADTDITTPILYEGEETSSYVSVMADLGREEMASFSLRKAAEGEKIEFCNFKSIGNTSIVSSITSEDTRPKGINISFEQAKQLALDTLAEMNIRGFDISDSFLYEDSDLEYYGFSFERNLNDVVISYGAIGLNSAMNKDPAYDVPLGYEHLSILIDDTGVVGFEWNYPLSISEILNENVEIQFDAEKSSELISKQLFFEYADLYHGLADKIEIHLNRIQLSLARIRYKGHPGEYILVPVWDFYGDVKLKTQDSVLIDDIKKRKMSESEPVMMGGMYIINIPYQSLGTVNALDGTIINRELGY